jgi:hypothetical protein
MKSRRLGWSWIVAAALWAVPAGAAAPLVLTLEDDTAVISEVTPNGQVALFA